MSGIECGKYLRHAPCKSNVVSELLHIRFDTSFNISYMDISKVCCPFPSYNLNVGMLITKLNNNRIIIKITY